MLFSTTMRPPTHLMMSDCFGVAGMVFCIGGNGSLGTQILINVSSSVTCTYTIGGLSKIEKDEKVYSCLRGKGIGGEG